MSGIYGRQVLLWIDYTDMQNEDRVKKNEEEEVEERKVSKLVIFVPRHCGFDSNHHHRSLDVQTWFKHPLFASKIRGPLATAMLTINPGALHRMGNKYFVRRN